MFDCPFKNSFFLSAIACILFPQFEPGSGVFIIESHKIVSKLLVCLSFQLFSKLPLFFHCYLIMAFINPNNLVFDLNLFSVFILQLLQKLDIFNVHLFSPSFHSCFLLPKIKSAQNSSNVFLGFDVVSSEHAKSIEMFSEISLLKSLDNVIGRLLILVVLTASLYERNIHIENFFEHPSPGFPENVLGVRLHFVKLCHSISPSSECGFGQVNDKLFQHPCVMFCSG